VTAYKWHRSRWTGNYFIFHNASVERISVRQWKAKVRNLGRTATKEFTRLGDAKKWVEKTLERRRRS